MTSYEETLGNGAGIEIDIIAYGLDGAYNPSMVNICVEYLIECGKNLNRMTDEDALDYLERTGVITFIPEWDIYGSTPIDLNDSNSIWKAYWEAREVHRELHFASVGEVA